MASRIITKKGSGAPLASDLVHGELAVDTVNKRLYTENAGGTIIELGTAPSTIDINAGTIDGTVIGGSSAAAGSFTTISASGEIAANGGVAFGDNDKATFGASDDLQIYHDGSNSYIQDLGTGDLNLLGSNLALKSGSGAITYASASASTTAITLNYGGSAKLATTSTGIDVTGTVTADGLTVDGAVSVTDSTYSIYSSSAAATIGYIGNTANDLNIYSSTAGHNGLRFHVNGILPTDNTGTIIDADADLGDPSYRFKDLYLSGGVYLGGTGAANHLDDYEEGTWTGTLTGGTTAPTVAVTATGTYTKVGRQVTVNVGFNNKDTSGATGAWKVTGLPFTCSGGALGSAYSGKTANATDDRVVFISSDNSIALVSGAGTAISWSSAGSGTYAHLTIVYQTA